MKRRRANLFKQLFFSHLSWLLEGLKKCNSILKDKQSRLFLTVCLSPLQAGGMTQRAVLRKPRCIELSDALQIFHRRRWLCIRMLLLSLGMFKNGWRNYCGLKWITEDDYFVRIVSLSAFLRKWRDK